MDKFDTTLVPDYCDGVAHGFKAERHRDHYAARIRKFKPRQVAVATRLA